LPARKQDRADLPDGEGLLPPSLLADRLAWTHYWDCPHSVYRSDLAVFGAQFNLICAPRPIIVGAPTTVQVGGSGRGY
jgi:hypothetical protein